MNQKSRTRKPLLMAALNMAIATPVWANSEIDELRQELAAQKALIQQLINAQKTQQLDQSQSPQGVPYTVPKTAIEAPPAKDPNKIITFYGVADVGIHNTDSGMGNKWTAGTGGWMASRFGINVEKHLTPDLKAVAVAEAGVHYGTGSAGAAPVTPGINNGYPSSTAATSGGSQLFGRQIYAGISSASYGSLTLGRQYSGTFVLNGISNSLGFGGYGYAGSLQPANGIPSRVNNSLVYISPPISGFSSHLLFSTGSENNTNRDVEIAPGSPIKTNDKAGRGFDIEMHYSNGPLLVGASTWSFYNTTFTTGETGLAKRTGVQLGGAYDFGPVKFFGNYMRAKIDGNGYEDITQAFSKTSTYSLSALVPFGKHKIYVSYTDFDDQSNLNRDAKMYGLGYSYQADDTTKYYFSVGRMNNSANASFSLADGGSLVGTVTTPGKSVNGIMAGVAMGF